MNEKIDTDNLRYFMLILRIWTGTIMLGYMNLEWGETQKSLAFFQLALEYYPNSEEALQNIEELQEKKEVE